jgi:predicted ATPase
MDTHKLGWMIYKKTKGNPFFVNQLLSTLHRNGHIRFLDPSQLEGNNIAQKKEEQSDDDDDDDDDIDPEGEIGGWMCDTAAIKKANYTSNVVDLMVESMRKLPTTVQYVLGAAATIGSRFEVLSLTKICCMHKRDLFTQLSLIIAYVFRII